MKERAQYNLEHGLVWLKRWWVKKYALPPVHELFVGQSVAELELEFFEDLWAQREEVMHQLEDEDTRSAERSVMYRQLSVINNVLGLETESSDPLVDQWEKDLAEGRVPDLEAR